MLIHTGEGICSSCKDRPVSWESYIPPSFCVVPVELHLGSLSRERTATKLGFTPVL